MKKGFLALLFIIALSFVSAEGSQDGKQSSDFWSNQQQPKQTQPAQQQPAQQQPAQQQPTRQQPAQQQPAQTQPVQQQPTQQPAQTQPAQTQPVQQPAQQQPAQPAQTPAAAATGNFSGREDPDAANWDIAALDTAANADYLTGLEKDVVLEMNKVRTNPKKYSELYIQPRLKYFNGNRYSVPGQITLVTQEGAAAVNDCINALNRASSVGILKPEKGLSLAAKDHAIDQSKTGQTGHNSSDGSTPEVRMKRYGVFSGSWTYGENISYGDATGRNIVCSLLIDDGVSNRGHRTNIMNKAFTQIGAGSDTHKQYRTSCTIDYANGYRSN